MHPLLFALVLALSSPDAGKAPAQERAAEPEKATEQGKGTEQEMPEQNIAFVLPEGWFVFTDSVKKPGLIAAFGNEARTKLVLILRDDKNAATDEIGEKFEREYEKGLEQGGGGKRQWGKFVEIAGFLGYERLGRAKVAGKDTSVLNQVFIADGKHYSLQGMLVEGGDASLDLEVREAMASFRFLKPPPKPVVASKNIAASSRDSAAYRAGYFAGKVTVTIAVIVGVIVGIVAIAQKSGRKSRRHSRRPAADDTAPPVRPVASRPPPIPGAPAAAHPPIRIIPRGGVKPRHPPAGPSSPPPSRPS